MMRRLYRKKAFSQGFSRAESMTFYVTDQNRVFVVLLVLGAVFGVLRDLLNVKRCFVKSGTLTEFAEDFICCIIFALLYHITVFAVNYGYVRWFEFAGVFLGFFAYRMTVGVFVYEALCRAVGLVIRIIKLLLSPVVKVFMFLKALATVLYERYSIAMIRISSERVCKKQLNEAKYGFYHI